MEGHICDQKKRKRVEEAAFNLHPAGGVQREGVAAPDADGRASGGVPSITCWCFLLRKHGTKLLTVPRSWFSLMFFLLEDRTC